MQTFAADSGTVDLDRLVYVLHLLVKAFGILVGRQVQVEAGAMAGTCGGNLWIARSRDTWVVEWVAELKASMTFSNCLSNRFSSAWLSMMKAFRIC